MDTTGLPDRLVARLVRGRAAAEARMLSTVTVRRDTGNTEQNESTGAEDAIWADVYTGPFRLGGSRGAGASTTVTAGGVEETVATRTGHFPAATEGLADNDLIEVTAGENSGLVLRIIEATFQDQATAHRVPVVETKRPTEWG